MPFCPKCGVEYRPGFNRCADCDVDLVERLSEEIPWEGGEPVELTRRESASDARMIREALTHEGIPCVLRGDEGKDMLGPILGASMFNGVGLNDVVILVPEKRLPEAQGVLAAFFQEGASDENIEFLECSECGCPVDPEDEVCPACGEKLAN